MKTISSTDSAAAEPETRQKSNKFRSVLSIMPVTVDDPSDRKQDRIVAGLQLRVRIVRAVGFRQMSPGVSFELAENEAKIAPIASPVGRKR